MQRKGIRILQRVTVAVTLSTALGFVTILARTLDAPGQQRINTAEPAPTRAEATAYACGVQAMAYAAEHRSGHDPACDKFSEDKATAEKLHKLVKQAQREGVE